MSSVYNFKKITVVPTAAVSSYFVSYHYTIWICPIWEIKPANPINDYYKVWMSSKSFPLYIQSQFAVCNFQDFKEIVLSKTQRKTPTVVHKNYAISRIRHFYVRKIKFAQQTIHDKLTDIISEFPKLDVGVLFVGFCNMKYGSKIFDSMKISLSLWKCKNTFAVDFIA